MTDNELIEILLFFDQSKGDAKLVASHLMHRFDSFGRVLAAPMQALEEVPDLPQRSVATLKLLYAAAIRVARSKVIGRPVISNWGQLMIYLNTALAGEHIEQFLVLFLDDKKRLITDEVQARGTVNLASIYPREVAKRALELQSSSIILAHNHPNGDPTPSHDEIVMTEHIVRAAGVLSVGVYDHLILGNGIWVSFRKEGLF